MSHIIKFRSVHSGRLERWLGKEHVAWLGAAMKGWYAGPIHLLQCPGSVRVCADGDFIGSFDRGVFMSAMDSLSECTKRAMKVPQYSCNAGFTSIGDAIARAAQGHRQMCKVSKLVGTSVPAGTSLSQHKLGTIPPAGVAAGAAPGGTVCIVTDTGALYFQNPSVGSLRLTGADISPLASSAAGWLLYDRIFAVAKTMNSIAAEAVTGVPTRYQSLTSTDEGYVGGNFVFVETGLTALAATAHNWTVCTYTDDQGNASTLPSLVGVSAQVIHVYDHAPFQWFAPLEGGDVGIKALTQIQCDALVATGAIDFVLGHPIGFMYVPIIGAQHPLDWLTNRSLAPRVFDNACLSIVQPNVTTASPGGFTGQIYLTSTAT